MRAISLLPAGQILVGRTKSGYSRQRVRLQAIHATSYSKRNSNRQTEAQCNRPQEPFPQGNAQSALLRQLKKLGLRTENEPLKEQTTRYPQSPPRHVLKRIDNCSRRQDNRSMDNKSSGCKSFLIRKKNISVIPKKAELHHIKPHQVNALGIRLKVPQLHLKVQQLKNLRQELNGSLNSNNSNQTNPKLIKGKKESLHTSMTSHAVLKVKAIICKAKKKLESTEMFETEPQHKEQGSDEKIHKKINKMIKKVRKLSHSEYNPGLPQEKVLDNNASSPQKKSQKSESNDGKGSLKDEKEKGKLVNCCKTVRIFWGQAKQQVHDDPPIKQAQKQEIDLKSSIKMAGTNKSEIFGSISLITRRSDGPIDSFRQLFHELYVHQQQEMVYQQ